MAISYPEFSKCLTPPINGNCWDPRNFGAFGLYLGAVIATIGVVALVGGDIARRLRK